MNTDTPESELTLQAREVLALLSKSQCERIMLTKQRGFWCPKGSSAWSMLGRMNKPSHLAPFKYRDGAYVLTEIGSEIARLIELKKTGGQS